MLVLPPFSFSSFVEPLSVLITMYLILLSLSLYPLLKTLCYTVSYIRTTLFILLHVILSALKICHSSIASL